MKIKHPIIIVLIVSIFISCSKDDSTSIKKISPQFMSNIVYGDMTDQEGNTYKTLTIGTQTWMAQNLRSTKYNDGSVIPYGSPETININVFSGKYCTYNNTTDKDSIIALGNLYNWYAVNTSKLAPIGWHVASETDWKTLIEYLGGKEVAGGKLKENGIGNWKSPNSGATNETGFTALPGGQCDNNLKFQDIGNYGYWWSATEINSSAYAHQIIFGSGQADSYSFGKERYFSVRCVKN